MDGDGPGLYERLLTEALAERLAALGPELEAQLAALRPADVADRIALHLGQAVRSALADVDDDERVEQGVGLARKLIEQLGAAVGDDDLLRERLAEPGQVLSAIAERTPDGRARQVSRPLVPLLDTTLLTNAPGEPRLGHQVLAEIDSAHRIDVVMAFIRQSGVRPLLAALRRHCEAQRPLRVLTTTYTGSTEGRALDLLSDLGADVRVSYDHGTTRLHAKAWLFHRGSGFSTAYIGSSNLTHSAQIAGLEWNVRASAARNPEVVEKVAAVFESYWNSSEFVPYDPGEFAERRGANRAGASVFLPPTELRPEPFQERLLEQIALSREQGHHANLLVSATGTGKTVMAAIDYARLWRRLPRARLLFVAHRKEILTQSLDTFRHALREPSFGELWVGGERPQRFEHVFASVQSLQASGLSHLPPDHFDVVIVDEFHHAAADSYRDLLEHLAPRELLGLTATPERSDGLPLLHYFGDRIAAELRLWDAIDQHRLSPFAYYGIHDGLDLSELPWKRGRGYDVEGLEKLYTGNDAWARQVIQEVDRHVDDVSAMRALGFCVSVEHARFMARHFEAAGIAAAAIWADTPARERRAALTDLARGRVRVLFSVDLFNEGVDLPDVDTLLLLRPTESPTLFLQQLGRGLRRSDGKALCTVLDFVGRHRQEFRFDRRLRALLGGSRKELARQIERGFPFLPAGCHMELDRVAQEIVLQSLQDAVPSRWPAKVDELRRLARDRNEVSLGDFLEDSGLDLEEVYAGSKSWSDLRAQAGLDVAEEGPEEQPLRRACGRMLHVDDRERLDFYQQILAEGAPPDVSRLGERQRRLARMLVASVGGGVFRKETPLQAGTDLLWRHPQVLAELRELFSLLRARIDHVHHSLATHPSVPLQIHARYTRVEILAAFGVGDAAKVGSWQTGVRWVEGEQSDLFVFTLDKTSGDFSPTTRYRDYAISPTLVHWESQSRTRADSDTGLRYQRHASRGSSVHLFAQLRQREPFWYLGPARYVSHQGEKPMAITWRLDHALPGDLFAQFAAAVA